MSFICEFSEAFPVFWCPTILVFNIPLNCPGWTVIRVDFKALSENIFSCCPVTVDIFSVGLIEFFSEHWIVVTSQFFEVIVFRPNFICASSMNKKSFLNLFLFLVTDGLPLFHRQRCKSVSNFLKIVEVNINSEKLNW